MANFFLATVTDQLANNENIVADKCLKNSNNNLLFQIPNHTNILFVHVTVGCIFVQIFPFSSR